jgi:microcystin-dependent protein
MGTPFLAMMQYYAFYFAPKGWLQCNGQLLNISQYSALFALLGTYYGGNGQQTFALPDMRGRSILGQGQQYTMGEKMGAESATLLTGNMPVHTHSASATVPCYSDSRTDADQTSPGGNVPASMSANMQYTATPQANTFMAPTAYSVTVGNQGASQPFSTMNPYLALTCCISITGIFPSRN